MLPFSLFGPNFALNRTYPRIILVARLAEDAIVFHIEFINFLNFLNICNILKN